MPGKFATKNGGGDNVSIGVKWELLPAAQSYALLFDDKHPVANNWVHWLVVDIPSTTTAIPEGASRNNMPSGSRELVTSWGQTGYDGPQPPVGSGDHEYVAHLYALDVPKLEVDENISRSEFLKAIEGHVIAEENYSGWFERK
ncbi:YbhB/YbcL family Raf kinase inhibitor-like protein [Candidatus Peregrinibacteria bacterium]|nr:YbhB/YbcL family Raf kinase inhibitor-like protein [Candidatus Peregrinibacteria bacterium]